jgi:hypothetical protein
MENQSVPALSAGTGKAMLHNDHIMIAHSISSRLDEWLNRYRIRHVFVKPPLREPVDLPIGFVILVSVHG